MDKRINIKNRDRVIVASNGIEFSKISNHWLFKVGALIISGLIIYAVTNSIILTIQKIDFLKKAQKEVQDLRLENLHLSIGIKDMSTDKYLEKEARDRLNFGGKDEIVFVIPESTLELAKGKVNNIVHPEIEPAYEQGGNIDKWVSFIIAGV